MLPPVSSGADQATVSAWSPGVTASMVGALGVVRGVPRPVPDQDPSPTTVTARTCTSYSTPLVRPPRSCRRSPEVQTLSFTVQLSSALLGASLRM